MFSIEKVEHVCFGDERIDFVKMQDNSKRGIRLLELSNGNKIWERYYIWDGVWSQLNTEKQVLMNKAYQYWKDYLAEKVLLLDNIKEG